MEYASLESARENGKKMDENNERKRKVMILLFFPNL